ncbi:hypothetical protein HMPREF0004_2496 [Achromobacter piechaudii ATCC 43553]|uniref:Uncharacterized protein n=1 Tax=Achromobacter piechaudii ATCC 43553 TaxID=742159 RepID=D4XAJ9_9BURK|nr:hypothetical protein HMPREF0004_2496 [Achromobacter piechaudii ATCC 43553]
MPNRPRTRCPPPLASRCQGSLPRRFAYAYVLKRGGSHEAFQLVNSPPMFPAVRFTTRLSPGRLRT